MILFTIFVLTLLMLLGAIVMVNSVIGTIVLVIFGDVIVFIMIMIWLIKKLFFKKKA